MMSPQQRLEAAAAILRDAAEQLAMERAETEQRAA